MSRSVKRLQSSVCDRSLAGLTPLKRHMLIHLGVKPFKSSQCPKLFRTKQQFQDHFLGKHTKERPYKCNLCDKGFVQKAKLIFHITAHTGERPFKCPDWADLQIARSLREASKDTAF